MIFLRLLLISIFLSFIVTSSAIADDAFKDVSVGQGSVDNIHKPKKYAVLIGISDFDDPKYETLKYPGVEAKEMADIFLDSSYGNFDKVIVLNKKEETNRRKILLELENLRRVVKNKNDIVVIYIAAHGELAYSNEGRLDSYLVTTDTKSDNIPATGINLKEIRYLFENLHSQRNVLIFAFCHSEISDKIRGRFRGDFSLIPFEDLPRSSIVIGSTSKNKKSFESDDLGGSVYTHYFLEALRERKDENNDGAVNVTEAHNYAAFKTYYYTGGKQEPVVKSDTHILGSDTIYLVGSKSKKANPVIYDYSDKYAKLAVEVDGKYIGDLNGSYAIKEGSHRISLREKGGKVIAEKTVNFDLDESYYLSDLFEKNYDFNTYLEVRGGVYIPKKSGFKNTYKIDLNAKYFTWYPTDYININLAGGVSYMPDLKTKEEKSTFSNGEIISNHKFNIFSLNNAFIVSLSPAFISGTMEVGAIISFN